MSKRKGFERPLTYDKGCPVCKMRRGRHVPACPLGAAVVTDIWDGRCTCWVPAGYRHNPACPLHADMGAPAWV